MILAIKSNLSVKHDNKIFTSYFKSQCFTFTLGALPYSIRWLNRTKLNWNMNLILTIIYLP